MIQEKVQNLEEERQISKASVPGSLDQMGPPQEEDHMGRSMEIGSVPDPLPAVSSV